MFYTRLSLNFQPKSAFSTRRCFVTSLLAVTGGASFGVISPIFAASPPVPVALPTPPMMTPITDKEGALFRLQDFRGTPLLINFWATWCPPCVTELPALEQAAKELAGTIRLLLVSVDRGGINKALPFLDERGIKTPLLGFDPKAVLSREMGVRGLPTTFLISADQARSWPYVGPREWDQPDMLDQIRLLTDSKSSRLAANSQAEA